jgi:hypothetical protein
MNKGQERQRQSNLNVGLAFSFGVLKSTVKQQDARILDARNHDFMLFISSFMQKSKRDFSFQE